MSKLIILQGPPCSDKSTWAAEYKRQEDPEVVKSLESTRKNIEDKGVTQEEFDNIINKIDSLNIL